MDSIMVSPSAQASSPDISVSPAAAPQNSRNITQKGPDPQPISQATGAPDLAPGEKPDPKKQPSIYGEIPQIPVLDVYCPSNALKKMPEGPAVTAYPYEGAATSFHLSDEHFSFSIGTIDGILLSNNTGRGHLTLRENGVSFYDAGIRQVSAQRLLIQPIERTTP